MNLVLTQDILMWLGAICVAAVGIILYANQWWIGHTVRVLGRNYATDVDAIKRLKPIRGRYVKWRREDGTKTLVLLVERFGRNTHAGPLYEADITPGQGRLIKTQVDGEEIEVSIGKLITSVVKKEATPISGDEMMHFVGAEGLQGLAKSTKKNEKMAILAGLAILGVVAMLVMLSLILQAVR